jgi:hypothetical protein
MRTSYEWRTVMTSLTAVSQAGKTGGGAGKMLLTPWSHLF